MATFQQCSELQESKKEDDDQNDEFVIQTEKSFTRVAFIGLSNWALDPAKMNRGIKLCRNEPDEDELEETAR